MYSCANWDGLCDHMRDVPWEHIFKPSVSAAASEFCKWVQIGFDVYNPHRKYHKSHSSPYFSTACAAAITQRNHFFVCTNRINFLNLKFSLNSLVIVGKGFLKLPSLHMLIKQKNLSLPRNLALGTFGKLLLLFSTKVNLLYLLYSMTQRWCLLRLITQNCLLKTFLRTLFLITQVSFYLFSFTRTNLKQQNVSVTCKLIKKVITNPDSSGSSNEL